MKKNKHYSLILTSNTQDSIKRIYFSHRTFQFFKLGLLFFVISSTLFFVDYIKLSSHQIEVHSLRKKHALKQEKVAQLQDDLSRLQKEVRQIRDINHRIRLITGSSLPKPEPKQARKHKPKLVKTRSNKDEGYLIMASSSEDAETAPSVFDELYELSLLTKKETWDVYTSLLEKQNLIDHTPSILPVEGGYVSSEYGFRKSPVHLHGDTPQFHNGVDIAAQIGSPVVATAKGCIIHKGFEEMGYGNLVVIDHGYSIKTYYAHLSSIKHSAKPCVERGDVVGFVGQTGRVTGAHLHYEIRILGTPVNPNSYILHGRNFN